MSGSRLAVRVVSLVAAMCLLGACGDSPPKADAPPAGLTLAAAVANVRQLVDQTQQTVLPGISATAQPNTPLSCEGDTGPDGTTSTPYGFLLQLPQNSDPDALVNAVADLWTSKGYELLRNHGETARSVHGYKDGYEFGFQIKLKSGRIQLGGSTPCLPSDGSPVT